MISTLYTDNFLRANDIQLHYRRWKAPNYNPELPSVLLLHGLASSSYIWNLVAPLLARQGYDVVALDQRGHGESAKPEQGYDFATILADDLAVVRALNLQRPLLVGHSWGAMAALELAATPESELSGLVLVDGALQQFSQLPGWTLEKTLEELAPPRYAGVSRATFLSFFEHSPLAQNWTPEIETSVLHIVDQHTDGTISPRLTFENHLQIIEAMWHQPTLELYARVHCPLKIVLAEQEPVNDAGRERAERRRQNLAQIRIYQPETSFVIMQNTIHDIPLQRPQELADELLPLLSARITRQPQK